MHKHVHPTDFCKREGVRGREEKEEREKQRTKFIYTVFILFHQGSEMANAFMRVYQGNWIQNQTRLQK